MLPCPVSRWLWPILRPHLEASLVAQLVKNLPIVRETQIWSLGQEDTLEKELTTHSSNLACRIPGTEEPGGLQPMGSQRVRHTERLGDEVLSGTAAWLDVSPSPTGRRGIFSRNSGSNGVVVRCAGLHLFLDCDSQVRICRFISTFWGTQHDI